MKILLYSEGLRYISKSGVGRAIKHQMEALKRNNVEYTLDTDENYDIVHINTIGPKSYMLAKEAKKKGKKVVYHAHSTQEDFRNSFMFSNQLAPLVKKIFVKSYTTGDYIITPTEYSKRILEGYGINKPIENISNGIDIDFFKYDSEKGKAFRDKYNYKSNDKVVMAVGLYIERKGILDFVEIAKKMPQYKFIWFGYTPLYSVPPKISKAVNSKLDNLLFPGYVNPEELLGAYSGANLYIFPTHEETEGITLLEAIAVKQQVLIRDEPIFSCWLEDGVNVYKAKNNEEFQSKITDILEGRYDSLTEKAYEIAYERNLNIIGSKLKKVYEILLENK